MQKKNITPSDLYKKKYTFTIIVIILLGFILRISQYLFNRSLWLDEACISLNITQRSFAELLLPLDYAQGAPIGFLFIVKSLVILLGNSDWILRLYSLLCGILSILLFFNLAKIYLEEKAAIYSLTLFIFLDRLIYFSSEVKQYAGDVFWCILLYIAYEKFLKKDLTVLKSLYFGLIGSIVVWFSHASVIILGGICIFIFLKNIFSRKIVFFKYFLLPCALISISIAIFYFASLKGLSEQKNLLDYWGNAFMPLIPINVKDFKWFIISSLKFLKYFMGISTENLVGIYFCNIGFSLSKLAKLNPGQFLMLLLIALNLAVIGLVSLMGAVSFYSKNKEHFFLLLLPIILTLILSGFRKYPFLDRMLLFLFPTFCLFIAEGLSALLKKRIYINKTIILFVLTMIYIFPLTNGFYFLFKPRKNEEIKPIMEFVKKNWGGNDIIYLNNASYYAFSYYAKKYGFSIEDYMVIKKSLKKDWENYEDTLIQNGETKRLWVLLSHYQIAEKQNIILAIPDIGKEIISCFKPGAFTILVLPYVKN
ncbi:MAG: hypothetical protein ACMUJM_21715 [bacterium]